MVISMRPGATSDDVARVIRRLRELGLEAHIDRGETVRISVRGESVTLDERELDLPGIERIDRVPGPYRHALRATHPADTIVDVSGVQLGGDGFTVIAGPCAVEDETQLLTTAAAVKDAGAVCLRGGAFKPRRSPYSFQGLREEGLALLAKVSARTGLPVVTEITSERQIDAFERHGIDMYQVGARSMYDYELLRALGEIDRPVLLKRAFSATLDEFLFAAEYILSAGNPRVVLCERGIRTHERAYRFTLDLNAVAWLRDRTHLPVIVDPSHGTGDHRLVTRLALAATAAGAHGLLVEVHPDPAQARSDAAQQLSPPAFAELVKRVQGLHEFLGHRSFTAV